MDDDNGGKHRRCSMVPVYGLQLFSKLTNGRDPAEAGVD